MSDRNDRHHAETPAELRGIESSLDRLAAAEGACLSSERLEAIARATRPGVAASVAPEASESIAWRTLRALAPMAGVACLGLVAMLTASVLNRPSSPGTAPAGAAAEIALIEAEVEAVVGGAALFGGSADAVAFSTGSRSSDGAGGVDAFWGDSDAWLSLLGEAGAEEDSSS